MKLTKAHHAMATAGILMSRQTVSSMASMEHHVMFSPLPCNGDFTMDCEPLNVTDVISSSAYVIPCGTCQVLTESVNFAGGLNVEGHLQILPPVNMAEELSIQAPFILVQGKFTADMESEGEESITQQRSGSIHIELVEGDGTDIQMVPHPHNSMACGESMVCNFGKRPFAVAGGMVDIRGYKQSCPSWTNLIDIVEDDGLVALDPSEYEHPPQPPSAECSAIAVWQDFEEYDAEADITEANVWDGSGALEYGVRVGTPATSANHYFEVVGRGPRVFLAKPECLTPGAQYLFSADIMLSVTGETASICSQYGGWHCPRLVLYTSSKRWRRLGVFGGKGLDDETWATFQLAVTFTAEEVGPSSNNGQVYLFIEGPDASIIQSVDNFLLELAPPATYPDPNQVCAQLLPNGDAESSSGGNIFPFTLSGGRAAVVTDESNGNSFFRQSGRYAWYNRLQANINPGCVVQDAVYKLSFKVWVHSTTPTQAEIVAGFGMPDGSTNWGRLLFCPASDESSGFVSCERVFSFSPQQVAATSITLFIRPRGSLADTVEWDDLSLEPTGGVAARPIQEILVDPTLVHDCWADPISEGAELLLTSHTLDAADHQVVSTTGMTADGKISLASPIANPMSGPDDFAVEVALLSRRITLEASSESGSSIGGHFIVFHTPHVNQTIRGLEVKGFGQQGNLGRYVSIYFFGFIYRYYVGIIDNHTTHLALPHTFTFTAAPLPHE